MQKLLLLLLLLLALLPAAHAQIGFNSPAGVTPTRDAEIYTRDGFVVQQKYTVTTDPISGNYAMICAASPPNITATTGILFDPGGTGNYPASVTCTQTVMTPGSSSSLGYELTFTQFNTEADGDSVVISGSYGGRIAFSGSALPPVLLVPGDHFVIILKSDSDSNVGTGFVLRWRQVSLDRTLAGGNRRFGIALQFDPMTGALRSGLNGVGGVATGW